MELTNMAEEGRKQADYIYIVSDNGLIISMTAELDHHLADEMRNIIDEVIDERGVSNVIFDFSKIGFMDSAGIGLIMGRYKKIREKGSIYITGAGESINRILLISGLHKLVVSCGDVNEAVIKIKEGGKR
ncbi:MAG: anti-sigma factor antagonist [Lachnospira sp.]|nr:anti-sigma factor antagonist [Lachnospira sp.]